MTRSKRNRSSRRRKLQSAALPLFVGLFLLSACIPVPQPGDIFCTDDNQCWGGHKCLPPAGQTGVNLIKRCRPPEGNTPPPDGSSEEQPSSSDGGTTPESNPEPPPSACKSSRDCTVARICCDQRCYIRTTQPSGSLCN